MSWDDYVNFDDDEPPDPSCYSDCVRLGDEVTVGGVTGCVCWSGPGRYGTHRLGLKFGDDPEELEFYDCTEVTRSVASRRERV